MKKNFIQLFMFAATMLMATVLTGCGDDIIDNGGQNTANSKQTVFLSGDDDLTRTSINNKRAFFWEKGDKIWIYDGSQWQQSTKSNIAAPKTPQAKFVLSGSYNEEEYQLLYTGYANGDTATTQYNKVTIADVQTQAAWNDGSHLGTSGDCGTAKAYKQENGTYRFSLEHKASYLLFYPYLHTDLTGDYTLEKIEVYSDLSASTIAGTFDFDFTNGLLNSDGTPKTPDAGTAKQEMTLNCGNLATGEFGLPKTAPVLSDVNNAAPHCFMVIAPGTHQLTIRYVTKKSDGTQYEFIKDIALKQYQPNGVYTFVHELQYPMIVSNFKFRQSVSWTNRYFWGATRPRSEVGTNSAADPSSVVGNLNATNNFWKDVPNQAAMTYYSHGGGYNDNAIKWTMVKSDGTEVECRGGVWLKKKAYLAATIGFSTTTKTRTDGRLVNGRPTPSEIDNYFFLPRMTSEGLTGPTVDMRFWTSTSYDGAYAYCMEISTITMNCAPMYLKTNAWLCYPLNVDGTPWFQ